MKQSAARIRPLLLLSGAALAVLVLLLWSGGGQQTARAYPGLTVGIDLDTSTTTDLDGDGIYETIDTDTFENCIDVTNGQQFDVMLFMLESEPDAPDLTAFQADVEYEGSVVEIIAAYTGTEPSNLPTMFMSAQPLSDVQNESQNYPAPATGDLLTPDTDGKYEAAAFDASHTDTGDDGSGILVRVTLETVAVGISPFNIDTEDIDGDGYQDRGVMLRDVNAVILGDANFDGFYDGPYINSSTTIAVDQPDSNDNGISDVCESDDDMDGICNPGMSHPSCTGSDNCPDDYNPLQEDMDGDGLGDVCDVDKDGDGFINDEETSRGSLDDNLSSTPEVCDDAVTDEDGDGQFNEGYDYLPLPNGNNQPDCTENVDTDGDTIPNLSDPDDDNDWFNDDKENWTATDSLIGCADTTTFNDELDDKWPPDADDTRTVNILDVLKFKPAFNSSAGDMAWRRRFDLNATGTVNILDILKLKPHFNSTCQP
jgi:hypothetical protein